MKISTMISKFILGLVLLFSILGFTPDTLQSTYEKAQKENGMDHVNIIHIEENEHYGLVLATSWNEQFKQNKDRPGIGYYEKVNGKWSMRPGTDCGTGKGSFTLGLSNGDFLYCGVITLERPFIKIMVGQTDAKIFDVSDRIRVWYVVEKSRNNKQKY